LNFENALNRGIQEAETQLGTYYDEIEQFKALAAKQKKYLELLRKSLRQILEYS
jgi:hypothetical protein